MMQFSHKPKQMNRFEWLSPVFHTAARCAWHTACRKKSVKVAFKPDGNRPVFSIFRDAIRVQCGLNAG